MVTVKGLAHFQGGAVLFWHIIMISPRSSQTGYRKKLW